MSTFPLGSSVSVWPLIGGDTQKHWVLDQLLVGHGEHEHCPFGHACRVLLMVRGTYRYQSHQELWTELRMRIREIAQSRVRYGYRKIRVLLNREAGMLGSIWCIGCTRKRAWP